MPGRKQKRKSSEEILSKSTLEILPIRFYDEQIGSFILEDKSYLDILELIPSDRDNLQGDELKYIIILCVRFYRIYSPDGKIMSMYFPINTWTQRTHLQRKWKKATDAVRKKWLQLMIEELETLDQNVKRREYYLVYFGRDKEEFLKNKTRILKSLGYGRNRLVKNIGKEKKIQILRKICNMNTLILPDDLVDVSEGGEDEKE